jgi:hypothetical protein
VDYALLLKPFCCCIKALAARNNKNTGRGIRQNRRVGVPVQGKGCKAKGQACQKAQNACGQGYSAYKNLHDALLLNPKRLKCHKMGACPKKDEFSLCKTFNIFSVVLAIALQALTRQPHLKKYLLGFFLKGALSILLTLGFAFRTK